MSDAMNDHVPDWVLEKYLLGEASADDRRRIEGGGPAIQTRLDRLRAEDAEIRSRLRPLPRIVESREPRASNARPLRALKPVFAAVAMLALVPGVMWLNRTATDNVPESMDRIKGDGPTLQVYRKKGEAFEKLADGASVRPGDLLQITYRAADARYGAVVSVDGRGTVTPHLPERGATAVELKSGGEVILATSFELDAAPGFEKFVFLTSNRPFDVAQSLRSRGADVRESSITLRKPQ